MRKMPESQRFPNSATLFKFCLRVLETRKPDDKIHDQDVGNILEYNPSDTSHWKRGKKSVHSIYALEALSKTLDVDLETIQELAEGRIDFEEAWFEFSESEEIKRINPSMTAELALQRRDRALILDAVAAKILGEAKIESVPVYVPEMLSVLPFIQAAQGELSDRLVRTSRVKPGLYAIRFRKKEVRAHTRVALAREVARVILFSEREVYGIPARSDELSYYEILDLSNALLVPKQLLREEIRKIRDNTDSIKILSEVFWVSKTVIRSRIAQVLLEGADAKVFTAPMLPKPVQNVVAHRLDLSEDDSLTHKFSQEAVDSVESLT